MVKEIPLQNGMVALVDDEDFERVSQFNWYYGVTGDTSKKIQVRNGTNRTKTSVLSKFILEKYTDVPKSCYVIFSDGNNLNFQKENLKITNKQGLCRISKGHKNSTSKYKGVSWDKRRSNWLARIHLNGKTKYLGNFNSEDDAAKAYNEAALDLIGEGVFLNKIGMSNYATDNILPTNNTPLRRKPKVTSSIYKGVSWDNTNGNYVVHLRSLEGNNVMSLGRYIDEQLAAKVYDQKAYELYGDKAILNFPECINEYRKNLKAVSK